ncbi:hypothetical protein ACFP51_00310 [Streptomyces pratens]|uniref:Uncharacterized protein n=1 Tax=Streptomyces pratens TaxID=887456 RepID=A0ABW1LTI6_9ACTN
MPLLRRCLEVCQESGNRLRESWALVLLGGALVDALQYVEAVPVNQRAVVACRALGYAQGLRHAMSQLEKAERGLRWGDPRRY